MKLRILLTFLIFNMLFFVFAEETAKQMSDAEIEGSLSMIDIEGKQYDNVKVNLKSISPDYFISDIYKVTVDIVDSEGKTVWKKTLKNVYLYVFPSGQIQVGKPNFDKIVISKNNYGSYIGKIREKEGIY